MIWDYGSVWSTDPFTPYDEHAFLTWSDYWPEMLAVHLGDGRYVLAPNPLVLYEKYWNDDPWVALPTWLCDPNLPEPEYEDDFAGLMQWQDAWYLPEASGNVPDESVFLHELSNHVADNETCVIRMIWNDYGQLGSKAWAVVGGRGSPESRIASLDMNEAYERGAALEGGRLLIGYYDDAA